MLPDTFNLADYSTAELKHIFEYLKNAFEGQDINLERELIEHYRQRKDARDQAMTMLHSGEHSSAAAALLNATTSALKEVARLQTELYDAERVKLLERLMTEVLRRAADGEQLLQWLDVEMKKNGY